jgi:hypothetical protein
MRYVKHNIYENFSNANGCKDDVVQRNILVDELSEIIATQPMSIRKALNEVGIKTSMEAPVLEVVDKLVKNIKNKKLKDKIVTIIINRHNGSVKLNANGDNQPTQNNNSTSQNGFLTISKAIDDVFGILKSKEEQKQAEEQTKKELIDALKNKGQKVGASAFGWFGVLLVTSGLIYGFYRLLKR